jgi:hypothetical protein
MKHFFLISFLLSMTVCVCAQTIVKGVVKDAATNQPLQYVSVYFKNGKGVQTNADGSYSIQTTNVRSTTVSFSYVGYKTLTKTVVVGINQTIDALLIRSDSIANVVVSTEKHAKYRNKNNPAVELIRNVIDNKAKNRLSSYNYVEYEQYEKMELSLTKEPEKLLNNKFLKNYKFVFENPDSNRVPGKVLLPIYLDEALYQKYFRKSPDRAKTYILGRKQVDFGEFIDNNGVKSYLNRLYQDIDVYQNNISILTNEFLSPIADLGPTFYMYYIKDTIQLDSVKLVRLNFYPRNPNDLLFKGTIFITLDGNYAVQKITMTVSKHANLNFTRELRINQDFERGVDGKYHVSMSNMFTEFAITKNAANGMVGERTVTYRKFKTNQPEPDSVYKGPQITSLETPRSSTDSFWVAHRDPQLSNAEAKAYSNIDSLQKMPSFRRFMDIATLLLAGYKQVKWYEVGPVSSFYNFNPVEGFRIRLGGRSTPKLSNSFYFENYAAYGFQDHRFKYYLSTTYSFNHKSIYAFPLNYLRVSYQQDTKIPGQELQFVAEDNFFLSFKRGDNTKWLYNNTFKIEYVHEFGKNISYTFGFKNWKQSPAGTIYYEQETPSGNTFIQNVTTTEFSGEIRWAPNEQFYQGKNYRIPIFNKYPIFRLRYIAGIKGLMNGAYNYGNWNANIFKRFYLSQLGYTDVTLEGGYITGKVPFPLLTIHRANQTYAYQLNSYNLMNFMEFVSDRYAAINVDHYFNGFIFNKIPFLKKLKLREAMTGRILFGGVRDENNPSLNNSLFKFPTNSAGTPTTYTLNGKPYIEASVGIGNIFKLLRLDYVKRFNYLDHPEVATWGIRARLKFDF